MLELSVTPSLSDLTPTIVVKYPRGYKDFH